jgi:flavin reductase (DIM6/NTAB) family NADH-FMN oxidoreductase RutF
VSVQDHFSGLETLDLSGPIWERFFTIAPLVLVGTVEADGSPDFAPKHMAFPLGWENYFGFVCTPRHATYGNAVRSGVFTVTYPRPADIVMTSLAASPRFDDTKPILNLADAFPAQQVDGYLLASGYLFFECELLRIVDGFGANSLIAGRIVAAHAHPDALRRSDRDDAEILLEVPQLAYLYPGRFAIIDRTEAFPFPDGMQR